MLPFIDSVVAELPQIFHRHGHWALWPVCAVLQTPDSPQFSILIYRVCAFINGVTLGCGKATAAFPNAKCVFAQAGVALDSGNR